MTGDEQSQDQSASTTGVGGAHPSVVDRRDQQRYEIVDDDRVLGFADYRPVGHDPTVLEFPHTVIDPAERGRGLGDLLIDGAMADVRRRGALVVPTCWFVAQWFDARPAEQDMLASSRA